MRPDFISKFKLLKWGNENKQQEESNKSTEEKTEGTENNSDAFFAERKFPAVRRLNFTQPTPQKVLTSVQILFSVRQKVRTPSFMGERKLSRSTLLFKKNSG